MGCFIGAAICSEYDAWERYRSKVNAGAFATVKEKISHMRQNYYFERNEDALNDCIKLENLLNKFKDDIEKY